MSFAACTGRPNYLEFCLLLLRCALLLVTISFCGGVFLLEQPNSSILNLHDRFIWLVRILRRAHTQAPWQDFLASPLPIMPVNSQDFPAAILDEIVRSCNPQTNKALVELLDSCPIGYSED